MSKWYIAYDDGTYSELNYFDQFFNTKKLAMEALEKYLIVQPLEKPYLFICKEEK